MVFDYRARDREAHSHALGLGRKESIEQPGHGFGIDPFAGITNGNVHPRGFALARAQLHLVPPVVALAERVERVRNEVYQDFDELGPIANDSGQRWREIEPERDLL